MTAYEKILDYLNYRKEEIKKDPNEKRYSKGEVLTLFELIEDRVEVVEEFHPPITLETAERVYYNDPYHFNNTETTPEILQKADPNDIINYLLDIIDELQTEI